MKHIRKFEELNYSTYNSAADKLDNFGQTSKAKELRSHAVDMSKRETDGMTFGILVGGVRPFNDAKFKEMTIFKSAGSIESKSWIIRTIFTSGNNTHRIESFVDSKTGDIVWMDGNKFLDKKSTANFQRLVTSISQNQDDFKSFFSKTGQNTSTLKVINRTFYL